MKSSQHMHVTALAVVLLVALPLFAASPAAKDTVKIGKETKKTIGVVTDAVSGDVACYLTLKDDRGVKFEELADFPICEQHGLKGKRVLLTYALEKVMSDECQGDPECKKTRTVALVKTVKILPKATAKH